MRVRSRYLPEKSSMPFIADRAGARWRLPKKSPRPSALWWPSVAARSRGGADVSQSARFIAAWLGRRVVSAAAAPLGPDGSGGVLVVVHTGIRPRFTDLRPGAGGHGEAGTDLLSAGSFGFDLVGPDAICLR